MHTEIETERDYTDDKQAKIEWAKHVSQKLDNSQVIQKAEVKEKQMLKN